MTDTTRILGSGTTLYRVPELTLQVDTSNLARIYHQGRVIKVGPDAVALLDILHRPRTVAQAVALAQDRCGGNRAARQLLTTLVQLVNTGILRREPVVGFSAAVWPGG